jgi:hypothetical protein
MVSVTTAETPASRAFIIIAPLLDIGPEERIRGFLSGIPIKLQRRSMVAPFC